MNIIDDSTHFAGYTFEERAEAHLGKKLLHTRQYGPAIFWLCTQDMTHRLSNGRKATLCHSKIWAQNDWKVIKSNFEGGCQNDAGNFGQIGKVIFSYISCLLLSCFAIFMEMYSPHCWEEVFALTKVSESDGYCSCRYRVLPRRSELSIRIDFGKRAIARNQCVLSQYSAKPKQYQESDWVCRRQFGFKAVPPQKFSLGVNTSVHDAASDEVS